MTTKSFIYKRSRSFINIQKYNRFVSWKINEGEGLIAYLAITDVEVLFSCAISSLRKVMFVF